VCSVVYAIWHDGWWETGFKPPVVGLKIVIYTPLALSSRPCFWVLKWRFLLLDGRVDNIYASGVGLWHHMLCTTDVTTPSRMYKVMICLDIDFRANTALASGIK
jgi:hypothetical protein